MKRMAEETIVVERAKSSARRGRAEELGPGGAKISQLRRRARPPIGSAVQRLQRSSSEPVAECRETSHRQHHSPPQPCGSASTGSRSPYVLLRAHCPLASVCSPRPENQGRLVQGNALQHLSRHRPERRQQDFLPAEVECQGSDPCLPRRANPREAMAAHVPPHPARRRAHGPQVSRPHRW